MSKRNIGNIENDTDTLRYYNTTFVNNGTTATPAIIRETRTSPILESPNEWVGSVVRFDIDTRSIPINTPTLVQPVVPISANQFSTTSVITLEYQGNFYSQHVIYIEEANSVPSINNNIRDFKLATIYNYQKWLDFVNTAVAICFSGTGATGSPPIFIFNGVTGLIDLYVDQNYIPAAGANQIKIFVNLDLYLYFVNFDYAFDSLQSSNPFYRFQFICSNSTTSVMPAIGSRQQLPIAVQSITNLYRINQYAPGTASWSSLRSLILTSSLLPIRNETLPNSVNSSQNYLSSNILPIISDFVVPTEAQVTESRVTLTYLPTAQYRYFDLVSNTPLYSVDFNMYWTDYSGQIYPIYLDPGQSMNIKILFQKRNSIQHK